LLYLYLKAILDPIKTMTNQNRVQEK